MASIKNNTRTDILAKSIPLFADCGYDGVSMRQIAGTVGIKAASLYHHFPDKQRLYVAALGAAFAERAEVLAVAFTLDAEPRQRLQLLIHKLCDLMAEDREFSRLLQREILHGDEQRIKFLADNVFADFFTQMTTLCLSVAPHRDAHLTAVSVISLVMYHYQIKPLRAFLPGFKPPHNAPETIANHIVSLLEHGLST